MKTNKFIYALSLAAVLGMSSCGSDFLNTPTDSRVELDSNEKLRMLLVSSYPSRSYAWPCEIMSDNMVDNNAADDDWVRYNLSAYDKGDDEMFRWEVCVNNTDSESPSDIWEGNYQAIAGANAVLEQIEKLEAAGTLDDTQKAIKGEALMIRSFCHFILAQCFCHPYRGDAENAGLLGIPYIKRPEMNVKPHYERGTLKETYDNIRKDLEEGLPLISNNLYEVPKYHFNLAASHAYAARFYLFTRDYEKCLEHSTAAFGGEDPSSMFSKVLEMSDKIFSYDQAARLHNGADQPRNLLLISTYATLCRRLGSGCRYGVNREALMATFLSGSPAWIDFYGQYNNTQAYFHPATTACLTPNGSSEFGWWFYPNASEMFEYTNKLAGIGYPHITKSEFTAEEMVLTRAEAKLFLGDIQGALDDLTIWEHARRKCPNASTGGRKFQDLTIENIREFYIDEDPGWGIAKTINIDMICPSNHKLNTDEEWGVLQCIQHYRRIELMHTGMRWFDIKRYGIEFDRKIGKTGADHLDILDERKAIQIPAEIQAAGMQPNKRFDPPLTRMDISEYLIKDINSVAVGK